MSVTSVGRSATPSILVAAVVSAVRPTRVSKSPRLISVLGRMGISVAVAPRVILRRNTPRAAGRVGQLGERLAVDLFVRHQNVDALHRHGEQLAVLDFLRRCAEHVHQHFALARNRHHVAFLQDGVRGRIHDLAAASNAQDEEARIGHQRLSLSDAQAGGLATRLHLVGAQRPAVPARARHRPAPSCRPHASPRSPCRQPRD